MQGKHLAQKKQFYIEKRRGEGVNQATIAREFNPLRSTISRELRRNTDPTFNGVYSCRRAHTLARGQRHVPLPDNAFHRLEPHIQDFIRQALSTHTSPEVIRDRLQLEFGVSFSKNTFCCVQGNAISVLTEIKFPAASQNAVNDQPAKENKINKLFLTLILALYSFMYEDVLLKKQPTQMDLTKNPSSLAQLREVDFMDITKVLAVIVVK